MRQLPRFVAETTIGRRVPVTVVRDGKEVELAVDEGQLEENEARAIVVEEEEPEPADDAAPGLSVLGMELKPLSDEDRETFKIKEDVAGVLVAAVTEDGRAAEKRIVAGDVILEVGQREVKTPKDVESRLEKLKSDGRKTALLTLANNQGELRFTALRLEE